MVLITGEDILQLRQSAQLLDGRACNFEAARLRVMAHDRLIVRGEPHVEFEAVTAIGESLVERRQSIFRNRLQGAGAPVPQEERARARASHARRNQSRSKSRIGLPVSGVSFAFRTAS